uniref:WGS project CBMI000000000 data, contig CS3069_c002044 n=1 Tax=Fusarium clavum TaxID=2594811 RepID=A0A090MGK8_9HYPO|nr:unnamed protein product [Fusarium clavum]
MERASVFTAIEQRVMERGAYDFAIVHTIDVMSLDQFEHEKKFNFFRTFPKNIRGKTILSTYREWRRARSFAEIKCREYQLEQDVQQAVAKRWRERNEVTPCGPTFHGDDLIAL